METTCKIQFDIGDLCLVETQWLCAVGIVIAKCEDIDRVRHPYAVYYEHPKFGYSVDRIFVDYLKRIYI